MADGLSYTPPDRLVQEFASRGLVILSPESLGIDPAVHARVYEQELRAHKAKAPITTARIPDVLDVLNAPGLVDACNRLVGDDWAVVPFTHNASFTSGARDQHWHKDDNAPFNARKQRHHQAVQIELLYYPQAVRPDMGPTATVPYSHYWSFDHEENQDNFAGAEHLDFNYQLSGMEREPISGPDSKYAVDDIVQARTAHDVRMREAVTGLGWPLVLPLEAAPLRAGSVVIYSHNTFHRGNHRRDDWRTWDDEPRFMWRFWLYRTTDPKRSGRSAAAQTAWGGVDPLTGVDLAAAGDDVTAVWRHHEHWLRTGTPPPAAPAAAALTLAQRRAEADRLSAQLHAKGEAAEPQRIGAAYRLAAIGDPDLAAQLLGRALRVERESVRRAATHGLIALGEAATATLLEATASPVKWLRKAGVYGLGDASPLTGPVLDAVVTRLRDDPSVCVRSVAAGALGCLGRRAIAAGAGTEWIPACVEALLDSLGREDNRLAMDRAQGRSIKYVRPTDDSDICEGGGIDYGLARFRPVRSAVRENALWSLVILGSHGAGVLGASLAPAVAALRRIVAQEENVFCVGMALDALNRLAHLGPPDAATAAAVDALRADLPAILRSTPVRGWEALVRGGLTSRDVAGYEVP